MAHADKANVQQTRGVLRLDLRDNQSSTANVCFNLLMVLCWFFFFTNLIRKSLQDDQMKHIDLEFTHEQLSEFFQQLQTIQQQLDSLR